MNADLSCKTIQAKTLIVLLLWILLLPIQTQANAFTDTGEVDLVPGLNLLGMPVDPTAVPNSYIFLPLLGNKDQIEHILWLNPNTGKYEETAYDEFGNVIGSNFPLRLGDAWLVYVKPSVRLTYFYDVTLACPQYTLNPGISLVSFPFVRNELTAYALLTFGGPLGMAAIQGLDPDTGLFQTASILDGVPRGPDFSIHPDRGYFVFMRNGLVYNPVPVLTTLDPGSAGVGSGPLRLIINGREKSGSGLKC